VLEVEGIKADKDGERAGIDELHNGLGDRGKRVDGLFPTLELFFGFQEPVPRNIHLGRPVRGFFKKRGAGSIRNGDVLEKELLPRRRLNGGYPQRFCPPVVDLRLERLPLVFRWKERKKKKR